MYLNSEDGQVYTAKVTLSNNALYDKIGKGGYFIDDEKKEIRVKYNTKYNLPKKLSRINWNVPVLVSIAKGRSVRAKAFDNVPDSTGQIWTLTESGQLKYVEFKKVSFVDDSSVPEKKKEPIMKVVPDEKSSKPIPQNSKKTQDILGKTGATTKKGSDPTPKMSKKEAKQIQEDANRADVMDMMKAVKDKKSMERFLLTLEIGKYEVIHKQTQQVLINLRFEKAGSRPVEDENNMCIFGETKDMKGTRTFKSVPRAVSRYFSIK